MESVDPAVLRVAIIGGGVAGAVTARELSRRCSDKLSITVFDQGRGLGGRAAHRRVEEGGEYLSATSTEAAFVFDHGCQFFRADSHQFRRCLLEEWLERGWVAEWQGKFGTLCANGQPADANGDFFGFPHQPPYYCGLGGMSALPCALLADAAASGSVQVRGGVRVAGTVKLSTGKWLLSGTSGKAALHDTAEEEAARVSPDALGEFDAVVVTDVSASMPGWHRASAGIPEELAARVRTRTRVCLFSALFAFEQPLAVEEGAFSAVDDTLWFASRTKSKPGLASAAKYDCWTLISTPKYAAAEVERVPMQDPKTGAFRPQEMSYMRDGPCAELLAAFERLLNQSGHKGSLPLPKAVYVGGQRWGSAFPAPLGVGGRDLVTGQANTTVNVLGVAYDSAACIPLAPDHAQRINLQAKEAFNVFDVDSSGSIDFTELRDKMLELGFMMDQEELRQMIACEDANKNGKIEFPEFLKLMTRQEYASFAARLLKAQPQELKLLKNTESPADPPAAKRPRLGGPARDFLADDEQRIYYTSDYVSNYLPGVEASALSALETARHLSSTLLTQSQ